jgi:hypothetical protein
MGFGLTHLHHLPADSCQTKPIKDSIDELHLCTPNEKPPERMLGGWE